MSVRERFDACKGLEVPAIGETLSDLEQDEITAELMQVFGQRTEVTELPVLPFTIQHTMYGDLDVSDWLLRYTADGIQVEEAAADSQCDARIRWEHWEDAVRLLNGDAGEGILLFTRRAALVGDAAAIAAAQQWLNAVDFRGDGSREDRPAVLVGGLRTAAAKSADAVRAYIEKKGLDRLLRARGINMAQSANDIGAGGELAGTYMRLEIDINPPVSTHTDFLGQSAETRVLSADEVGKEDPEKGVVLVWDSIDAFVDAVTFREEMPQQLTNGRMRVRGAPERLMAFSAAMSKLSDAVRPTVPGA